MENEILITGLAYGGEGVGRSGGKVCFVENALPGEKVAVKITQDKKKILKAKAIKWFETSPSRTAPPCVHIDSCGGCQYQHVSYEEELKWKETQVRDYLTRNLGMGVSITGKITGSSQPYGYRSSVTMHKAGENSSGYFAKDNRTITPIQECLLLKPELKGLFQAPWEKHQDSRTFRLNSEGQPQQNSLDRFFEIQTGGEKILTHTRCFFQNNLEITAKIGGHLKEWAEEFSPETFVDLYCGVGTFTFLSAGKTPQLMLAEENPWAVQALKKNLEARGLTAEILEGQVENKFSSWISKTKSPKTFLFTDPPRQGMDEKLALTLAKTPALSQMAYLSCHLGSLARDLKILTEKGGFKIKQVLPFDMFPRTKHIEILTLLTR